MEGWPTKHFSSGAACAYCIDLLWLLSNWLFVCLQTLVMQLLLFVH